MNFLKDPKYKSIRVILLLVIIVGAGWFTVSNMQTSNSNKGQVYGAQWVVTGCSYHCADYTGAYVNSSNCIAATGISVPSTPNCTKGSVNKPSVAPIQ